MLAPPEKGRRTQAATLPLLAASLVVVALSLGSMALRVSRPYPLNPWETGLLVEAHRALHGLTVFADPVRDHTSSTFGFLHLAWMGLATAVGGSSFHALRLVSVVSALLLTALVLKTLGGALPRAAKLVAAAPLLGLNLVTFQYFTDPRPDTVGLLLTYVALTLLYRASQGARPRELVGGLVAFAAATSTKQPMLQFCVVPALALAFAGRRPTVRELRVALAAPVAAALPLLVIRLGLPQLSYYAFTLPASYGYSLVGARKMALEWLRLAPLALVGAAALFLAPERAGAEAEAEAPAADAPTPSDARLRWLFAAWLIAVPSSAIVAGQVGDLYRLLPALTAGACLYVYALGRLWPALTTERLPLGQRVGLGALLTALLLASTLPDPVDQARWAADVRFGDESRGKVVGRVRELPGRVLSPNDPSIALQAGHAPGRCMVFEWDAVAWRALPSYVDEHLRSADYLVLLETRDWRDGLDRHKLAALGFAELAGWPGFPSAYSLWARR